MTIRFKNPPISELVIAAYFDPPLFALRSEHVGMFWSTIREQFVKVEQQQPVGGPQAMVQTADEAFLMPRYWFISEDKSQLIQIQKNAFILNWRRRDTTYPYFAENLKPLFDKYFGAFEEFAKAEAGEDELRFDLCELNYVNVVEPGKYWQGPQDTANVIPSFSVPDSGIAHSNIPAFNCNYFYTLDPDLQLHIVIRTGTKTEEPNTPVLVFDIRGTGRLRGVSKSVADRWYMRAHDAITECFLGLTNKEIQEKYWQTSGY